MDLEESSNDAESSSQTSRPSLVQVKAIIEFMEKYPDLANKKLRNKMEKNKAKKLWVKLSNITNALQGTTKSTKGWMKYWSDKIRFTKLKQKEIAAGNSQETLTSLEQQMLNLACKNEKTKHNKKNEENVKQPSSSSDATFTLPDYEEDDFSSKLIETLRHQASAMSRMAQGTIDNAKALQTIAEATYKTAAAIEKLATSFTAHALRDELKTALPTAGDNLKESYSSNRSAPGFT